MLYPNVRYNRVRLVIRVSLNTEVMYQVISLDRGMTLLISYEFPAFRVHYSKKKKVEPHSLIESEKYSPQIKNDRK